MNCYEFFETEKAWYLITEYCSNGSLFDYISKCESLYEHEAIEFFRQLISGVECLHKMGICHRDLNTQNILLDDDYNIKIADFGISAIFEQGQTLKTRCGTPQYMAPEIVQNKSYAAAPADIWSCGVIFFEMVNGLMPFAGDSDAEMYDNIIHGNYEFHKDIEFTEDCKDFISWMLETDPQERITLSELKEHILMQESDEKL